MQLLRSYLIQVLYTLTWVSIVLAPAQPSWANGDLCRVVLDRGTSTTVDSGARQFTNEKEKAAYYRSRKRDESLKSGVHYNRQEIRALRLTPVVNGHYSAWVTESYTLNYGNQTATISRIESLKAPTTMDDLSVNDPNAAWEEAEKSLDYVIETYRERRPHWTPEFLAKLQNVAREYLNESIYINIRPKVGITDAPLKGTIRLIRERDGLLPMERYLGIKIDIGNDLKIEPGNFAVAKEFNQEAWPELMLHLGNAAIRELEPGRANHYLTYADEYSKTLYAMLGFTPVPYDRILPKEGVVVEKRQMELNGKILEYGVIMADNVEWTPMEATQATLDHLIDLHAQRLSRRGIEQNESEAIKQRRERVKQSRINAPRSFRGVATLPSGEKVRCQLYIQVDKKHTVFNWFIQTSHDSEIWNPVVNNDFDSYGSSFGWLLNSSLPLKEGQQPVPPHFSEFYESIVYSNGRLHVVENKDRYNGGGEFVISVSPDLSLVTAIEILRGRWAGTTIHF